MNAKIATMIQRKRFRIKQLGMIGFGAGLLYFATFTPHLSAQIFEMREYRGKEIGCVRSGLISFAMPCELSLNYSYVLVGTIASVTETSEMGRKIKILPREIFHGDSQLELNAVSDAGGCLPELREGDQWLFYLQKDEKSGQLSLNYGSPSLPVEKAEDEIMQLRKLAAMNHAGIIRGNVYNEATADPKGHSADHIVTAKRKSDGRVFRAITDKDGNYQFPSLPRGSYFLTANTMPGLWAEDGTVEVEPQGCTSVAFHLQVDGRISGRILRLDGQSPGVQDVEAVRQDQDNDISRSVLSGEDGTFSIHGLPAGHYLVGININENVVSSSPRGPSVFYPGVRDKQNALTVEIPEGGEKAGVDFQLLIR